MLGRAEPCLPSADRRGRAVLISAGLEGLALERVERGETPELRRACELFIRSAVAAASALEPVAPPPAAILGACPRTRWSWWQRAFTLLDSDTYEQALELRRRSVRDGDARCRGGRASRERLPSGRGGVRRWWESFLEAMDHVGLDAGSSTSSATAGDRRVQDSGPGSRSGIETEQAAVGLATVVELQAASASSSSRASSRARAAARASLRAERALAQDDRPSRHARSRSRPRRSTASPVSSPPSIARSAEPAIARVESAKRDGAGSPLRLALVWKIAGAAPGERAVDQPDAQSLEVLAAGERVEAGGVGDHQRHRARQRRRDRLAGARPHGRDQLAHRQRREEHHRRGLAVVAALDRVDPLDRGRRSDGSQARP